MNETGLARMARERWCAFKNRAEVGALHGVDIDRVLERLGLQPLEEGAYECVSCGDAATHAGIGALRLCDGRLHVSCPKLGCLEMFSSNAAANPLETYDPVDDADFERIA